MKKMLDEHKNDLKYKFGYDEAFAETITVSVESIVDYFGPEYEDIAWNAVKSCKIVIANKEKKDSKGKKTTIFESVIDVLKRENMVNSYSTKVDFETLKRDKGVYISNPVIVNENNEFQIKGVERLIALDSSFSEQSPGSLAILTNQLMTLIKSYVNEYEIHGDVLVQKNGLASSHYKLSFFNDQINILPVQSLGEGLEKGVNSYDELKIVRINYDSNYEAFGFVYQRLIAGFMVDSLEMGNAVKTAELVKDDKALKQLFDESGLDYNEFLSRIDVLAQKDKERILYSFDSDKLKNSNAELEAYFVTSIVPMVRTLNASIKSKMGEDYVFSESKKLS